MTTFLEKMATVGVDTQTANKVLAELREELREVREKRTKAVEAINHWQTQRDLLVAEINRLQDLIEAV